MSRRVLLIGASPKTRLVLAFLQGEMRLNEIAGVLDRDAGKHGDYFFGVSVVGGYEPVPDVTRLGDHSLCTSLSERFFADRIAIQDRLEGVGFVFTSVVSSQAHIDGSASVTEGSIIFPQVIVQTGARIGRCCTLYTGALIEHDCIIDDNVEISPRATIAGGVVIESGVFVGINATILPHLRIGAGASLGAGAVVTRDVPPGVTAFGNPARARDR